MKMDSTLEQSSQKLGLFSGPATFMNIPASEDPSDSLAAILGVPFDCGTHPTRIGARYGPISIREQSTLVRPYQPLNTNQNPIELLNVVDCGNANVTPSVIEESFEEMELAALAILNAGAAPLSFGGDGAVSLPLMRAVKRNHPDLLLLHIDAHTDSAPWNGNALHNRYNTSTTFTHAAEEGLVDPEHSFHIGIRGNVRAPGVLEHTKSLGYQLIDDQELFSCGLTQIAVHLRKQLSGRPVYLCFDMDFFDPSCAPGVCTPTWGGPSAREGLAFLKALAGIDFVAADINTVSPPHDVGGITAFLAGTVALEILTLFCQAPAIEARLKF